MNTKDIGERSEAKILSALLDRDITVLKPWGDNKRYDFVIEKSGIFYRIQCKTGREVDGAIRFATRSVTTKNGKAVNVPYIGQADYFMVFFPGNKKIYCIKVDECGIDQCSLRLNESKNNQTKGVKIAENYELEKTIFV